jgi:hypothetical protein
MVPESGNSGAGAVAASALGVMPVTVAPSLRTATSCLGKAASVYDGWRVMSTTGTIPTCCRYTA